MSKKYEGKCFCNWFAGAVSMPLHTLPKPLTVKAVLKINL